MSGVAPALVHECFEGINPLRMLVEARDQREFFAARLKKSGTATRANFLKSLQAIRNKGRAHDQQAFDAALRQASKLFIGVRLHPWIAPEP